ncbi:MAG: transporter substrate-binding domain-containing protein, partial [Bacteroidota bacterium]|nr:transporter substrate-binding domain-containing protein [Bacteroidota bacterium]
MTYTYTQNKLLFSFFILTGLIYIRLFGFYTIKNESEPIDLEPIPAFDLTEIKQRGKLIALTDNSSTSFYIYKGDSMGYEYDQLRAFANEIGVELQMVVAKNMDSIFNQLNNGEVDIVAANLTVTQERMEIVDFTDPLMLIPQVLIQRKPEGWEKMTKDELQASLIRNTTDLSGKSIVVRKGSSFYSRLKNLEEEIGEPIHVIEAPGDIETEELIAKVAKGEIDFTIADENVALSNQTYYSNI